MFKLNDFNSMSHVSFIKETHFCYLFLLNWQALDTAIIGLNVSTRIMISKETIINKHKRGVAWQIGLSHAVAASHCLT